MARKTGLSARDIAREEFTTLVDYQHDLAVEVYEAQDEETKEAIDKLKTTLAQYNTGLSFDLPDKWIDMALFVVAVEVVKDLALLDIRVAGFTFIEDACVKCGGEV